MPVDSDAVLRSFHLRSTSSLYTYLRARMAYVDLSKLYSGPLPDVHVAKPPPPSPMLAMQPTYCPCCCTQYLYNPDYTLGVCPNCTSSGPVAVSQGQPPLGLYDKSDSVFTDSFMMTDMLHVVNDVLREQDDKLREFPISESHQNGTVLHKPVLCSCGQDISCYCTECGLSYCGDCVVPHKQDPSTMHHQIIVAPRSFKQFIGIKHQPVSKRLYSTSFDESDYRICEQHKDEKVSFFCEACTVVVCRLCAATKHQQHNCMTLQQAYVHFRPTVEELMGKTHVEINMLDLSFDASEKMMHNVTRNKDEAIADIKKIFRAHREAVTQRENEVIEQVVSIASVRLESLKKEKEKIESNLSSFKNLSSIAEKALKDGDKGQILVSHLTLSKKLHKCLSVAFGRNPIEDDSFVVKSNDESAQEALKSLCLLTTAPYPALCTAVGEGLHHPRVNRLCTVVLCTKDRAGQACLEGGERLFVQLKSVSGGTLLPVDIRDNQDGSYSINFRPHVKGEHQLVIAIRGQHIQGSPFTLLVDGGREYGRFGHMSHAFGSEGSEGGQFCRPWGIAADQHGNIIIGDRSNHRIQVFDLNGKFKHSFGTEGIRPGQFNRPAGVAVTREGSIAVADKDNHRIQVMGIDGTFLFMFGSKGGNDGQMIYPYDVAVHKVDGRIAVTDTGNHRLLIFSYDGILLGKFGYKGYLCGHFDSPRGIAFNDDGHIIVSDFNVHHILVIHPDGTTARILGMQGSGNGQFMRPQGIAVDYMGNFIIADTRNNRIVIMHPSGHFIAKFGVPGTGPGQFDRPTSVAVLPDGRIAIVDFGNSRIQIF